VPLFDGKMYDQYLVILMVRSLANVILRRVWVQLLLLRQKTLQEETNARRQKEERQVKQMAKLAMSAKEQIQLQVEQEIEPKLEQLLAQKIKPHAIKKKEKEETVFRKERNVKIKPSKKHSKKQFKAVPEVQGKPEDTASSLFKFAKEKFGVELRLEDDRKEAAPTKPSGKGFYSFRGVQKRGNTKFLDCYSMDIAPMNIFENQCIPVGIHNLSKSFRPNLNTIRVLSLGTKFIPKWSTTKTKNTFQKFREFKNQMNAKVFFSESETKPGVFERNKKFRLKSNFVPPTEYTAVNNFCWNVRDAINVLFEKDIMEIQNLSNTEKSSLKTLMKNKNIKICIDDTDKNLGPISADKEDVIKECHRQLYDIITYKKLSWLETQNIISKIKRDLRMIVKKHVEKGSCSYYEKKFILSKIDNFSVPHFYIIWKILKNPIVGRPIGGWVQLDTYYSFHI
jgi:hypothetical protein